MLLFSFFGRIWYHKNDDLFILVEDIRFDIFQKQITRCRLNAGARKHFVLFPGFAFRNVYRFNDRRVR